MELRPQTHRLLVFRTSTHDLRTPLYFEPSTHGILTPYPWNIKPPLVLCCDSSTTVMEYWPPSHSILYSYPWYCDPVHMEYHTPSCLKLWVKYNCYRILTPPPSHSILYPYPIQFQFNSLLKLTNNTLVFSITNHMIGYKTTFKSYMQYIIIQLYTYFKKCFLFLMRP